MKPNIFFLTIDSLREDKAYGPNKSSLTPNINSLIEKGAHFTQAISTSDATGLSLGSIFTAAYPFKTGITHFSYNQDVPNYFELLKKNGYNLYATVPDVSFFLKMAANFTEKDAYVYDKRDSWVQLAGGIGNMVVDRLETKLKDPWVYFVHLMDLHAPFYLPPEFDSEKYGKTRYDKMISSIDSWLGKFLQKIDLQKTLVVISADHGDYIPVTDTAPKKETKLRSFLKMGKKTLPSLEPIGVKLLTTANSLKKSYDYNKLKKELTEDELRTMDSRGQWHLYDELIRIPLIFSGFGVSSKKITTQVRHVDIFPTIMDILGLQNLQSDIHGTSLRPVIEGKSTEELVAYVETGSRDPKKLGNIIGIRTPQYKYLRSRDDPNSNVSLFDLKSDPSEKTNLAESKPELVQEMENLLLQVRKNSIKQEMAEMDDAETKKIQEELKKLGYL
jgi:arylsulfatase A-like enzyme